MPKKKPPASDDTKKTQKMSAAEIREMIKRANEDRAKETAGAADGKPATK